MKKIFYGFLVAFFFCQGALFAFETNTNEHKFSSFDDGLNATFSENEQPFFGPIPIASDCSASCDYSLILSDNVGDGWNGGQITITINNQPTNYSLAAGFADTFNIGSDEGELVEVFIQYTAADEADHSWRIETPQGDTVAIGGYGLGNPVSAANPTGVWSLLNRQTFTANQCVTCCDIESIVVDSSGTEITVPICTEFPNTDMDIISVEVNGLTIVSTANPTFIPCPLAVEPVIINVSTEDCMSAPATFPTPDYVDCGISVDEVVGLVEVKDADGLVVYQDEIDLEVDSFTTADLAVGGYTVHTTIAYRISSDSIKVSFDAGEINILPSDLAGGLVCNDQINVSLEFNPDNNCAYTLQPDDLLENISDCAIANPELFNIVLVQHGRTLPGVVDGSMVGKKIEFKIYAKGSDNFCWGYVNVEDKQGLNLVCENTTILCTNPILQTPTLELSDTGSVQVLTDEFQTLLMFDDCEDRFLGEKINNVRLSVQNRKDSVLVAYVVPENDTVYTTDTLTGRTMYDLTQFHFENIDTNAVAGFFIIKSLATDEDNISRSARLVVRRGVAFESMLDINSCSEVATPRILSTTIFDGDCKDDLWRGARIERVIEVSNANGLSTKCTQTIYVRTPTFSDFDLPSVDATISCSDIDLDISDFGPTETARYITPDFLLTVTDNPAFAAPTFGCNAIKSTDYSICNIAYTYSDVVFDACAGKKIIRTWNVLNWCTKVSVKHVQVILIDDFEGPTLKEEYVGEVLRGDTEVVECSSKFQIGDIFEDNCSEVTSIEATYYVTDSKTGTTTKRVVDAKNGYITGLPLGTHTISLVAEDACGNQSDVEEITVEVIDNSFPVAIMNKRINVSLGSNGEAIVRPRDVDEGSFDNCGIAKMEIRRIGGCRGNSAFSTVGAIFECCDAGSEIKVEFRVTDLDGNEATIWAYVLIEDGTPVQLDCPEDLTISCADLDRGQLGANDRLYGAPKALDNCGSSNVTYSLIEDNDGCKGTITRQWIYNDNSSKTHPDTCTQVITLTPTNDWTVTFPRDTTVECTDALPGPSHAIISQEGCENILVKCDTLFLNDGLACRSYQITYTVINDCIYDYSNPGSVDYTLDDESGEDLGGNEYHAGDDGAIRYTQIIRVVDNIKPVISCPSQELFREIGPDCTVKFGLRATATDNCSRSLRTRSSVDANQNGIFFEEADSNSTSLSINGNLPKGQYNVFFVAEDECGNRSTCTKQITLEDAKAPTPICYAGLSTALMPEAGMIEIWAIDFLKDATDNCTSREYLINSVEAKIDLPGYDFGDTLRIDCNVIQRSPVVNIIVRVTDEDGNVGDCRTMLIVQDNTNRCPQVGSSSVAVVGSVMNAKEEEIENVNVRMSNGETFNTSDAGAFAFADIATNNDYSITASKEDDILNGVSVFDATLMIRHMLAKETLTTPEAVLAADLDGNKTISSTDLLILRQLILRKIDRLPNGKSWKFIDANYKFESVENALTANYNEGIELKNLSKHQLDANFRGIKLGDLSGDAKPTYEATTEGRTGKTLGFQIDDAELEAGQTHEIIVKAGDLNAFFGYQFTLDFNEQALEVIDINGNALNVDESYFNLDHINAGKLATSYAQGDEANFLKGDALFTISVRANEAVKLSEALAISNDITEAVAYVSEAGAVKAADVSIEFTSTAQTAGFELFQNKPNPFNGETIISFNLPQNQTATLTVYDMSGKVLAMVNGDYAAGYNEVALDAASLKATGVLYYELATENFSAVKRMVVVK